MTQFLKTILISIFLFFQTSASAENNNTSTEIITEEIENSNVDTQLEAQENEELSELEKEALAAEEAELRESGIYEEAVEEQN